MAENYVLWWHWVIPRHKKEWGWLEVTRRGLCPSVDTQMTPINNAGACVRCFILSQAMDCLLAYSYTLLKCPCWKLFQQRFTAANNEQYSPYMQPYLFFFSFFFLRTLQHYRPGFGMPQSHSVMMHDHRKTESPTGPMPNATWLHRTVPTVHKSFKSINIFDINVFFGWVNYNSTETLLSITANVASSFLPISELTLR